MAGLEQAEPREQRIFLNLTATGRFIIFQETVMSSDERVTVGKLARLGGVSAQAVRFYEAESLLPAPARTAAGYRIYDRSALARLQFIRRARNLGLSLPEIKEVIRLASSRKAPCCRVRELLAEKLKVLNGRIEELTRFRDQLRRFVKELSTIPDQQDTSQQVCALIEMAPDLSSKFAPVVERKVRQGRRHKAQLPAMGQKAGQGGGGEQV